MGHDHSTETLTPEEQQFRDLLTRGDDYYRIELWQWAMHYYKLCAATGMHPDTVREKIEVTQVRIKRETRNVIIVVAVAALLVGAYFLFR